MQEEFNPKTVVVAHEGLWKALGKWLDKNGLELLYVETEEYELDCYFVGLKS